MNTRLLGALCIVGSLVGVADGIRQVAIGTTHEGTFRNVDTLNYLQMVFWLGGTTCAFLGLIALRATGTNPIFRLLAWLPVAAGMLQVVGAVLGLAGLSAQQNWPLLVGQLLAMAGTLVVAILVLAARVWRGWRAFTPLLTIITIPLGAAASAVAGGLDGWWIIINAAASVVLGYAVMSSVPVAEVRDGHATFASA